MLKKVAVTGFILLLIILPSAALAQSPLTLPAVEVDFWPEYDDPGMLVIYRITLPADISLPAQFTLRIPNAAGKPNAVASRQPDGSLVNLNYQQQANGAWSELVITATSPDVQVEYYDPGLKKEQTRRKYVYEWPGDYAVKAFTVQVQEPIGASQLQISPDDFGSGTSGADGLVYYTENIGAIPAGPPFKIQIGYDKPNDDLSTSKLTIQPNGANTPTKSQYSTILPWALGVLGAGLIVGGIVWYLNGQRARGGSSERARHKAARKKAATVPTAEGYVYCPQCGKRAASGDHFCRTCGAELRK